MKLKGRPTFDKFAGEIFASLVACQLLLVIIYWIDHFTGCSYHALHVLFDLDGEGNIPAWFSSAQLLVVALSFLTHLLRQPPAARPSKPFFAFAAIVSFYVSVDEAGQVHEQGTAFMGKKYIDWLPGYAGKHFWWIMLAVALLLV